VFKLDSDVNLAGNATTKREFDRFINNQEDWCVHPSISTLRTLTSCRDEDYRAAHVKMMLLGQDITTLQNCTELMPASINLTNLTVLTSTGYQVDPTLLEAAIQKYRAPWLNM
jgi:hypothetical protein